jgi:hypothetical protein
MEGKFEILIPSVIYALIIHAKYFHSPSLDSILFGWAFLCLPAIFHHFYSHCVIFGWLLFTFLFSLLCPRFCTWKKELDLSQQILLVWFGEDEYGKCSISFQNMPFKSEHRSYGFFLTAIQAGVTFSLFLFPMCWPTYYV